MKARHTEAFMDSETLHAYKVYRESEFLVEFQMDPHEPDCINFFNETWICFRRGDELLDDLTSRASRIEPNHEVFTADCQHQAPWHLFYISNPKHIQRQSYQYETSLSQPATPVYILDTWIDTDHQEFEGRARRGKSFTSGEAPHGTHVAGLIGGLSTGVNKKAQLISVQVLDGSGRGAWSTILAGLQWVVSMNRPPGVINLSIGGSFSAMVNDAINRVVHEGWRVVVAAGNRHEDACSSSPASAREAITVAASSQQDMLAGFSNHGPCVDIIAPGESILSAYPGNGYAYMSGTSMASPLVAGIWSVQPEHLPSQLIQDSLKDTIGQVPPNQPNRFAQLRDPKAANQCPKEESRPLFVIQKKV